MPMTRSMLPVLFVLLAACGQEEAPHAIRSDVVTAESAGGRDAGVSVNTARPSENAVTPVAATASEPAREAPAPDPGAFGVVRATFTHAVEARRPIDEARSFAVGERATLHLVVKNLGAPRDVTIEWLRGETVLGRTTLQVGTSPAWRTWAFRRVGLSDVDGGLQVRVVDEDGNVLHSGQAPVTRTAPASV